MDYPGDLYFFLNSLIPGYRTLYVSGILVLSIILLLCFFSEWQPEKAGTSSLRKIMLSSWSFLFLVSSFIFLIRIPSMLEGEQNIDEGVWIAGTAAFLKSPRLWSTFNTTTSGPLIMLPIILTKLTGLELSYASARLGGILFCIIPAIICCFHTFRIMLDEKTSRFLILLPASFFAFIQSPDYSAYNGEHPIILFTSIAILLHIRLLNGNISRNSLLLYGIVVGSLPFTKLQALPLGFILGFIMLIFLAKRKAGLTSFIILLLGALIPLSTILLWVLITGNFNDFWIPYIINNLNYGQSGIGINGSSWLYFKYFVYLLRTLPDSRFYFLGIASASFLLGAILLFTKKIGKAHTFMLASSAGLLFCSYYAIVKTSFFYQHYFLIGIIPASFFLASILSIAHETFKLVPYYKPILISFCILFVTVLSIDRVARNKNTSFAEDRVLKRSAPAEAIRKYGNSDTQLAIWGWIPGLYVQTGFRPGIRYIDCYHQLKKSSLQDYYVNSYLEDLKKNKPLIFVDAITPDAYWFSGNEFKHDKFPAISNYIKTYYKKTEECDGMGIFVRTTR